MKFKKLKYRIDEEKQEISIANAFPQFLSFSKRNITLKPFRTVNLRFA
jgi:hypothetical protein